MARYRDPLSSRIFVDRHEYLRYLEDIAMEIRNDQEWSVVRKRKLEFIKARNELQQLDTIPDVMAWFAKNGHRTMSSPLLGIDPGKEPSPYDEFKALGGKWCKSQIWTSVDFPYLKQPPILGSGWLLKIHLIMPEIQNPRFSAISQARGLTSLGLHVVDYNMVSRHQNRIAYDYRVVMLAYEWERIALLMKLKGKIRDPIQYEIATVS